MFKQASLLTLYNRLYKAYGPQHWWPAKTPFEVMVGAVLTQNTTWTNVEKAIKNLKQAKKLNLKAIHAMEQTVLAEHIRSSGYFNIKAERLKNLCYWLHENGGIKRLSSGATEDLRSALLSVNGIGPETADGILLYAFNRPVFVIDTYTRRLLKKLELINGEEPYEVLRAGFESVLNPDVAIFNEYHALIVRHAKQKCSREMEMVDCLHCVVEMPLKQVNR